MEALPRLAEILSLPESTEEELLTKLTKAKKLQQKLRTKATYLCQKEDISTNKNEVQEIRNGLHELFMFISSNDENLTDETNYIANEKRYCEYDNRLKYLIEFIEITNFREEQQYQSNNVSEDNVRNENVSRNNDERHATSSSIENQVSSISLNSNNQQSSIAKHSDLEKLKLPFFDGQVKNFGHFWQVFLTTIDRASCSKTEKFVRLISKISYEPIREQYRDSTPSDEIYDDLVSQLKEMYLNSDTQQLALLRGIEGMLPIKYASDADGLHRFQCEVQGLYSRAKQQQMSTDYINGHLLHLLWAKLPPLVHQELSRFEVDNMEGFISALKNYVKRQRDVQRHNLMCKSFSSSSSSGTPLYQKKYEQSKPPVTHLRAVVELRPCVFCGQSHKHAECPLSYNEKVEVVKNKHLCFTCLHTGHSSKNCPRKTTQKCFNCQKFGHYSYLCNPHHNSSRSANPSQSTSTISTNEQDTTDNSLVHLNVSNLKSNAIHKTIMVLINDHPVRMLIDEGSGRSFITSSLAKRLGLNIQQAKPLAIAAFMCDKHTINNRQANINLKSMNKTFGTAINVRVVDSIGDAKFGGISNQIREELDKHGIEYLDDSSKPVEVILGVQMSQFLNDDQHVHITRNLTALKTKLGWVLFGGQYDDDDDHHLNQTAICTTFLIRTNELENELNGECEDDVAETFVKTFMQKITFNGERYVTKLPWITPVDLIDNYQLALRRLHSTLNTIKRKNVESEYNTQIESFLKDGFAEVVDDTQQQQSTGVIQYLPHHPVIRPDKDTTKVRVVFDASAKGPNGRSLNEFLFKGNTTWSEFRSLINFRHYEYAMCADIAQAFLMVEVQSEDRDALRFLWKDNDGKTIILRMKRVPFGTSASPFLLYAAMSKHFETCKLYPETLKLMKNSFYVDDLILSIENESKVEKIKCEATAIMKEGGMYLRKWRTNSSNDHVWAPEAPSMIKVLGVEWNREKDEISIPYKKLEPIVVTKRDLSSILAQVFDPMGLLLPFTTRFKLFLQAAWKTNQNWDDNLPIELQMNVQQLVEELPAIKHIRFPRWIGDSSSDNSIIHVLTDASKSAIGCVVYLVQPDKSSSYIVASKQKLAKNDTIPNLELKALQMGIKFAIDIAKILCLKTIIIWSDSLINVQRFAKPLNTLNSKIAIKIWTLKQLLNDYTYSIQHIGTKQNVADWLTRGVDLAQLNSDEWKCGPQCLRDYKLNQASVLTVNTTNTSSEFESIIKIIDNNNTLCDMLQQVDGENHIEKLMNLIRASQSKWFNDELNYIDQNLTLSKRFYLSNYVVFKDTNRILRIMSRFSSNESLSYDYRYPIVIHYECKLTKAIVMDVHVSLGHISTYRTAIEVRQRYFIRAHIFHIKSILKECIECKIRNDDTINVQLAPWPKWKSEIPPRAFTYVHLDLFGPLVVQTTPKKKYYGIIFVCSHSKAVHLEVLADQSSSSVIEAIRRLCARRGAPNTFLSDNAANFKRTEKVLKELYSSLQKVQNDNSLVAKDINWIFQTAYSPWKGGSHERHISLIKRTLYNTTFRSSVSVEKLRTFMCEAEYLLNTKPLYFVDGEVITPSHYLGGPLNCLPPVQSRSQPTAPELIHIKYFSGKLNALWKKWRADYFSLLSSSYTNQTKSDNPLTVGESVLVNDDKSNRAEWPAGIVTKVYYSGDQYPRTAEIKLNNGQIITRSTKRLLRLPSPPTL